MRSEIQVLYLECHLFRDKVANCVFFFFFGKKVTKLIDQGKNKNKNKKKGRPDYNKRIKRQIMKSV